MENKMNEQITEEIKEEKKPQSPKKLIKLCCFILAAVIVIVAAFVGISALNNTCETPVKLREKYENLEDNKPFEREFAFTNGVLTKQIKGIFSILGKGKYYKEYVEDFEDDIERRKNQYAEGLGEDWKIEYKVVEKVRLEDSAIDDYQDQLIQHGEYLEEESSDRLEYYTKEEHWENEAERVGVSSAEMKKLCKKLKNYGKALQKVKVTDGYELKIVISHTGSLVEEPAEREMTIQVYKVNGRWVEKGMVDPYSFYYVF